MKRKRSESSSNENGPNNFLKDFLLSKKVKNEQDLSALRVLPTSAAFLLDSQSPSACLSEKENTSALASLSFSFTGLSFASFQQSLHPSSTMFSTVHEYEVSGRSFAMIPFAVRFTTATPTGARDAAPVVASLSVTLAPAFVVYEEPLARALTQSRDVTRAFELLSDLGKHLSVRAHVFHELSRRYADGLCVATPEMIEIKQHVGLVWHVRMDMEGENVGVQSSFFFSANTAHEAQIEGCEHILRGFMRKRNPYAAILSFFQVLFDDENHQMD